MSAQWITPSWSKDVRNLMEEGHCLAHVQSWGENEYMVTIFPGRAMRTYGPFPTVRDAMKKGIEALERWARP